MSKLAPDQDNLSWRSSLIDIGMVSTVLLLAVTLALGMGWVVFKVVLWATW